MANLQNNDELPPENKLEALKRLQKLNFLDPGEKEQLNSLQAAQSAPAPSMVQPAQAAPAATPTMAEAMTNSVRQSARKKMLEDLFRQSQQ
jgi:hypothetical protein